MQNLAQTAVDQLHDVLSVYLDSSEDESEGDRFWQHDVLTTDTTVLHSTGHIRSPLPGLDLPTTPGARWANWFPEDRKRHETLFRWQHEEGQTNTVQVSFIFITLLSRLCTSGNASRMHVQRCRPNAVCSLLKYAPVCPLCAAHLLLAKQRASSRFLNDQEEIHVSWSSLLLYAIHRSTSVFNAVGCGGWLLLLSPAHEGWKCCKMLWWRKKGHIRRAISA